MKHWSQMAESAGLNIPEMDRVTAVLDGLEAAFRPLLNRLAYDVEPAVSFSASVLEDTVEPPQ